MNNKSLRDFLFPEGSYRRRVAKGIRSAFKAAVRGSKK
jgi:hypothetical protein